MRWFGTILLGAVIASGCAVGVGYTVPISSERGERVEPGENVEPAPPSKEVAGVIVPGESTHDDVLALLGPPVSQHRDEQGNSVWTYWSNETAGGSYAHRAIRVVFDTRGIVARVDSHQPAP